MEAQLIALLQEGSSVKNGKKFRHNAEFPTRAFPLSKVKGGISEKQKKQSLSLHQKKTFITSLLEQEALDTSVS